MAKSGSSLVLSLQSLAVLSTRAKEFHRALEDLREEGRAELNRVTVRVSNEAKLITHLDEASRSGRFSVERSFEKMGESLPEDVLVMISDWESFCNNHELDFTKEVKTAEKTYDDGEGEASDVFTIAKITIKF